MLSRDVETHARTYEFCGVLPIDEDFLRDCLVYSELMDEPYVMLYWVSGGAVLGVVLKNDLARGLTAFMGLALTGRLSRPCLDDISVEDVLMADVGFEESYIVISCTEEEECCKKLKDLLRAGCPVVADRSVKTQVHCLTALTLEELLYKFRSTSYPA